LKEVLKLLVGKHFVDQFEDGLAVILVKLLDKPHLLYGCFIFNNPRFRREVLSEKPNKIKQIFFLTLHEPRGSILRYFDGMFTLQMCVVSTDRCANVFDFARLCLQFITALRNVRE